MASHSPERQNRSAGAGISVTRSIISNTIQAAVEGRDNQVVNISHQEGMSDDVVLAAARQELRNQLTGIRKALLEHQDLARETDREDAIEAVSALHADLGAEVIADRKTLRQRIKALAGALQPVADIIGGIAALEAIVRGL